MMALKTSRAALALGAVVLLGLAPAVTADDDLPAMCEKGGDAGLFLGHVPGETEWPRGLRVVLYLMGLLYAFLGVGIVADIFMEAIEVITSAEKVVKLPDGSTVTVKVWNATVANLTLMALGSSAPEILLSVIEIISAQFIAGSLGPSTIVGSAAFNLLVIIAVCVSCLPDGEGRRIEEMDVFIVTASASIWAYLWILIILVGSSPNKVDVWEGVLTFLFFPMLVFIAYAADRNWFRGERVKPVGGSHLVSIEGAGFSEAECRDLVKEYKAMGGKDFDDKQSKDLLMAMALKRNKPSRAQLRINAIRSITGGKRVVSQRSMKVLEEGVKAGPVVPKFTFESDEYTSWEAGGSVTITIMRTPAKGVSKVAVSTKDQTATAGQDYEALDGKIVEFADGVETMDVTIVIIDDDEPEDDEFFEVSAVPIENCEVGQFGKTIVKIVDDDELGEMGFKPDQTALTVQEGCGNAKIVVHRFNGSKGEISCSYKTEVLKVDNAAIPERDFKMVEGRLEFKPYQMSATIEVPIVDDASAEKKESFKLVISDAQAKVELGTKGTKIYEHEGNPMGECVVTISSDEDAKELMDKATQALNINLDRLKMGGSSWKQQFVDAMAVNGGDDEDGFEPSTADYVMHYLTLPFKLTFAMIPPTEYGGGWVCFNVALVFIGLVTALIGDLASLMGCTMGLEDSITAITFVALGTSLPDTFASKAATLGDDTADAAIGNVTGSNAVNVFLGLGLPWMIAAIYWNGVGINDLWEDNYGYGGSGKTLIKDYPKGGFMVPAGSLAWSVMVFSMCFGGCMSLLMYRRYKYGFELGGPKGPAKVTGVVLCGLWFFYVLMSSLEVVGVIQL